VVVLQLPPLPLQGFPVKLVTVEMPVHMQEDALRCAKMAMTWHPGDNYEMAKFIKKEFDRLYGKQWQCIVGPPDLGHYITYQTDCCICFHITLKPELRVILFRSHYQVSKKSVAGPPPSIKELKDAKDESCLEF
jgi:dynein light chain LC8-type